MNKVVENKRKENNNHPSQSSAECLPEFDETRAAEDIFVKAGDIIDCNPENRDKNQPDKKAAVKFDGNVDAKTLGFNNCFPVNKKYNPTDCRG
jgi:hypothetical protein